MASSYMEQLLKGKKEKNKGPIITFGADPEFFAINKSETLVPSWELDIEGDKGIPTMIKEKPYSDWGMGYLKDGVAVEFNLAPVPLLKMVAERIRLTLDFLENSPMMATRKLKFARNVDVIEVQKKYHNHPLYHALGCVADLDAFSEAGIRPPFSAEQFGNKRFAGGHIHIGCDPWPTWLPKKVFIQFLSIIYDNYDANRVIKTERDQFYGLPGIWRETPYGVEYRSPSTKWLNISNSRLDSAQTRIEQILRATNNQLIDQFSLLYNNSIMDEYRIAYNEGGPAASAGAKMHAFGLLDAVLMGEKLKYTPKRAKLSGYTRESDKGKVNVESDRDGNPDRPRLPRNAGQNLNWNANHVRGIDVVAANGGNIQAILDEVQATPRFPPINPFIMALNPNGINEGEEYNLGALIGGFTLAVSEIGDFGAEQIRQAMFTFTRMVGNNYEFYSAALDVGADFDANGTIVRLTNFAIDGHNEYYGEADGE